MSRVIAIVAAAALVLGAATAEAQVDEWVAPPVSTAPPTKPSRPTEFRSFAFHDAVGMHSGQLALSAGLGFPYVSMSGAVGLGSRVDVRVTLNTMYGLLNQAALSLHLLLRDVSPGSLAFGVRVGAAYALFGVPSAVDDSGPRWITGERNASATLSLVISSRGMRGGAVFGELGVSPNLDLSPKTEPLRPPEPYTVGANLPLRMGLELRISEEANFLALWGVDIHLRRDDSALMPVLLFGVTLGTPSTGPAN